MLKLKYVLLLCCLHMLSSQAVGYEASRTNAISWDSYAPGQLLHKLYELTMHAMPTRPITPKTARAQNRWDNDVAASASSSDFNYDRAYEDFVRKYFSDSLANDFSAQENNASIEESGEGDTATEASRKKHHRRQCKRVRRNRDVCNICRNPKSGEKMENCTYSTETTPHAYSYEMARKYKKTRSKSAQASTELDDNESNESNESDEKNNATNEDNEHTDGGESEEVFNGNQKEKYGSCTVSRQRNETCYICINSSGERSKKCHSNRGQPKDKDARNARILRNTQRIYP